MIKREICARVTNENFFFQILRLGDRKRKSGEICGTPPLGQSVGLAVGFHVKLADQNAMERQLDYWLLQGKT